MLKSINLIFLSILLCLTLASSAQAALLNQAKQANFNDTINNISSSTYNKTITVNDIIANTIQIVLGVLGIVFMVLIFIAGGKWMLANGNEERVQKSKRTIRNLLIGLILVLGAYVITYALSSVLSNTLLNK
jgi:cbb3-type cytochrome oxidase subunit 3